MNTFTQKYLRSLKRVLPFIFVMFLLGVVAIVTEKHGLLFYILPLMIWGNIHALKVWNDPL